MLVKWLGQVGIVEKIGMIMAEWRQKNLAKPNNPSLRTLLNALKVTT